MAPTVGWFGRTFGWSGSRGQWLTLFGVTAWLAGLVAIAVLSRNWNIGQALLAAAGWLFVLGVAARDAVRDLFGPVFFYDLLRVSRSGLTFLLRGFYVIGIGGLLGLMYFESIIDRYHSGVAVEFCLASAAGLVGFGLTLFYATRGQWKSGIRAVLLMLCLALAIVLLLVAVIQYLDAPSTENVAAVPIHHEQVSRFANDFFEAFISVQFFVMLLLTPVYVAGTIAVEKERKTLEFLLATDLRNREIIFGKLASRVMTLVMYVLAGLPLIAFLQLFGGIDPEQLLASTVATLVTILGLSALSIWVSTTLRKARDAIILTYLLVLMYGFISFLLAALASVPWGVTGWWNTPVNLFGVYLGVNDILLFFADGNPFWAVIRLQMGGGRGGLATSSLTGVLRDFVIFWAIAITLLLGSAILRIRRITLAQAYGPVLSRRQRARQHPKAGGSQRTVAEPESHNPVLLLIDGSGRRAPLTGNPVTWKEVFVDATFRGGCLGRLVAIVIMLLTFFPFGMIVYIEFIDPWIYSHRSGPSLSQQWYEFTEETNAWVRVVTGVLGSLMFISAAMRGAGAISGEKDRDTWISLVSTPLSAEEILWGKWWGCIFSLRRAFFVLLIVWSIGLATGSVMPLMMPVMLLLTAVYVSAFSWVGLYCSMTARTTLIASVRGFFAALFCLGGFWIVLGICCFMPLNWERGNYVLEDQLSSFFLGFTPPMVYGIFPLNGTESRDLGPFDADRRHSLGMTGPIVGTAFWILFNWLLSVRCRSKFREVTNRVPLRPRRPPREAPGDSSRTAE